MLFVDTSFITEMYHSSEFREAGFKSEDQYWINNINNKKKPENSKEKRAPNFIKPDESKYKKNAFFIMQNFNLRKR